MNPSQVSAELRRIATAINNSQNPSRERVLDDLRRVLASMDGTAGMDHEAAENHEAGLKDMVGKISKYIKAAGVCLGLTGCMPSEQNLMASTDAMAKCMQNHEMSADSNDNIRRCSDALGKESQKAAAEKGIKDYTRCKLSYDEKNGYLMIDCDGKHAKVNVNRIHLQ